MPRFVSRALIGTGLFLALASAGQAQSFADRFTVDQVRRVAQTGPTATFKSAEALRLANGNPVVVLITPGGIVVSVFGWTCTPTGCDEARLLATVSPPKGIDRQQLVDRFNEQPRWAGAYVDGDKVSLRGSLPYAGGISDANLAQYLASMAHHAARLAAGQF
ncbi:YbjN domain-containing protein [Novosphingobium sp. B 225]|uniref:YbjN domain-containing protein n=1 Tax=Novosphingobium sp. B 225 TaxID=1961849 RepID=UPI001594E956|nr:YbjN domain-containing protein [Novosphingobium sp. B 225]